MMNTQTRPMKQVGKKMVLVVEDSPTQARFIRELLLKDDIHFVLAIDGEMGVCMAQSLQPDLIVLDLEMPKLDGREVFRRLRIMPETRNIPVIIFSRHSDPELDALPEAGLVEYIPKDAFAGAVLMETLHQMGLVGQSRFPFRDI
ncbi:MAG TPA: hypothetical protein DEH25_12575 [Chloroflexi bacterium]|nr:hypothetical protein [Chloroflexota bacterium]HBY06461.1 hypothetical protein [Chloroflexota bacterium]